MRSLGYAVRLATVATVLGASSGQSQVSGVSLGYTDVGAVLGLGGVGGAGIAFGGRFEKVFKALPDLGDGLLGLQVGADFASLSGFGSSASWLAFGATANYHFKMEAKKFDPFLGAGLGYATFRCGSFACGSTGIFFITKAGIRYFMNSNMALYADVGVGGSTLNVGAVWKIRSGS